jgi:hypothetical protein
MQPVEGNRLQRRTGVRWLLGKVRELIAVGVFYKARRKSIFRGEHAVPLA